MPSQQALMEQLLLMMQASSQAPQNTMGGADLGPDGALPVISFDSPSAAGMQFANGFVPAVMTGDPTQSTGKSRQRCVLLVLPECSPTNFLKIHPMPNLN
jgi:hypothetical protein